MILGKDPKDDTTPSLFCDGVGQKVHTPHSCSKEGKKPARMRLVVYSYQLYDGSYFEWITLINLTVHIVVEKGLMELPAPEVP